MKEQGFNRDARQIKTKIKHLREVYRKHKDKINRSGAGAGNPPKFFEEIDIILGTSPQTQPPFVMDSGEPTSLTLENNSEDDISDTSSTQNGMLNLTNTREKYSLSNYIGPYNILASYIFQDLTNIHLRLLRTLFTIIQIHTQICINLHIALIQPCMRHSIHTNLRT